MMNHFIFRLCIGPGGIVCVFCVVVVFVPVVGFPPVRVVSLRVQVFVSVSVSGLVCLVWPFLSVYLLRLALSEFGREEFCRRRFVSLSSSLSLS